MFGLPFLAVGIYTLYLLVSEASAGSVQTERLILLIAFPLVFGGSGIGMIVADRLARRRAARGAELEGLYPDEPWRWNPDWHDGRVRGGSRGTMFFAWAFALFWNALSLPMLAFLPEEIGNGNHAAWIGVLFPLVGVGLLYWAVRATLRYRRFGTSELRLDTFPGVIGGRLAGSIDTRLRTRPEGRVRITLTSLHRYRTGGQDKDTRERILWQDEYDLAPEELQQGPSGLTLPVEFAIPPNSRPTAEPGPDRRDLWRLEANAEIAGVDYHTVFEVPVFAVEDDEPGLSRTEPADSRFVRRERIGFDPADSAVRIEPGPAGGAELVFPAARNKGAAIGLTVFFLIFAAVTAGLGWWLVAGDMPLFARLFTAMFPVVFGLVSLLLLLFVFDAWTGITRVVIADGRLRARRTILGVGASNERPFDEIEEVAVVIGMTQSRTLTQSSKAYYDIEVRPRTGKPFKAGQAIPSKREAEWVAEQIRERIGR